MKRLTYGALALVLALGVGTFLWADGGGGGAASGGGEGGGGVGVTLFEAPAPREALTEVRKIYIVQEGGVFTGLMMPKVTSTHEGKTKMFMPMEALHGIYVATRKSHHPEAFTYKFTAGTMAGEKVTSDFPITVQAPEGDSRVQ